MRRLNATCMGVALVCFLWFGSVVSQTLMSQTPSQKRGITTDEAVPLTVSYPPFARVEMEVVLRGDSLYVPAQKLFGFLKIESTFERGARTIRGSYFREDIQFTIDCINFSTQVGDTRRTLDPSACFVTETDMFLKPQVFEEMFGLRLEYDQRRLILKVESPVQLPVAFARARERMRRQLAPFETPPPPERLFPYAHRWFSLGRFDWNLSSTIIPNRLTQHNALFRAGLPLLGGDFESNMITNSAARPLVSQFRAQWRYPILTEGAVRQIVLGDYLGGKLSALNVLGAEVSNRPLPSRVQYIRDMFVGRFDPFRDADVYLGGGRYVSTVTTNQEGTVEFEVPIRYGVDEFEVRSYSTWGEERVERYRVVVPATALPPRVVEYSISGGKLRDFEGQYYGSTSLAYGFTKAVTLTSAVEYLEPASARQRVYPSVGASVRFTNVLLGEFLAAPKAKSRASLEAQFPSQISLTASVTHFAQNPFLNAGGFDYQGNIGFGLPIALKGARLVLSGSGQQTKAMLFTQRFVTGSATMSLGGIRPGIATRYGQHVGGKSESRTLFFQSAIYAGMLLPASVFANIQLQFDHQDRRFQDIRFEALAQPSARFTFRATLVRDLILYTTNFFGGLTYYFPFARASVHANISQRVRSYTLLASGSGGFIPGTGRFLAENLASRVGQAAIIARPFLDLNGNDVFDPDEEPIRKVSAFSSNELIRGNISAGQDGTFRLMNVAGYHDVSIYLDTKRVENPLWVPRFSSLSVTTEPNLIKEIDIPFVVGGIVGGSVTQRIGITVRALPGMEVHLKAIEGNYSKNMTSFSTGGFEFVGVPPGRYRISLSQAQLAELGLISTQPVREFEVAAKPEGDEVTGLDFVLE